MTTSLFKFYDYHPSPANIHSEVIKGLRAKQKNLPAKLFYDKTGSDLFDAICQLPEYYLTRVENSILATFSQDIASNIGFNHCLIELGCGSCQKIRYLLPHLKNITYIPVDISKEYLHKTASSLAAEFPHIHVHAVCHDYSTGIRLPDDPHNFPKIIFFPGSSISNFEPPEVKKFLTTAVELVSPQGGLLIGIDLKKDVAVINAAYNDKNGTTAAFNLNMLRRINRELNANFKLENFEHQAFYNFANHRIEMHLRSKQPQAITIGDDYFEFDRFESIHTENSYKFSIGEFQQLAFQAGFKTAKLWLDDDELFSVHYFGF